MNYEYLNGKRYISLVRCSTDEQTETSIPDQLKLLTEFAKQHGMIHAGEDVTLDGVSGSRPGARTDNDEVIRRKTEGEDFDVLLIQDISRLTRGGVEHGGKLEYDLMAAGIDVCYAASQVPEGDHAGIIKSVEFYAAQQYAKQVGFATARGQSSAILGGRQVHCMRPPYAIDRLYKGMDGRPRYIIRNRPDGSQVKLDPQTKDVLEVYPPTAKGEKAIRYRKQLGETVELVLGAEEQVEIVRDLFRRMLIDGWGAYRIAKNLNDAGIPGPNGGNWFVNSVWTIVRNPVYTGVGYANCKSVAVYNMRGRNAPVPARIGRKELATQKRPHMRFRDRADWLEVRHPALDDLLGPDLRPIVIEYQRPFLTGTARTAARRDRHQESRFILKYLLRAKQGGLPMTGVIKGRGYRYYAVRSAPPTGDEAVRRLIPAEPLEQAVMAAVREILGQEKELQQEIEAVIQRQQKLAERDRGDVQELLTERRKVAAQVEFIVESLGSLSQAAAKRKAEELEEKLHALDERIAKASAGAGAPINATKLAADAARRVAEMIESLDQLPPQSIRNLLAILISRLEVDLATRQVQLELALPSWAVMEPQRYNAAMGLETTSSTRADRQTHTSDLLPLATFDCQAPQPRCYECRRRQAA